MSHHQALWGVIVGALMILAFVAYAWTDRRSEKRETSAIPVFTVEDLRRTPGGGR